MDSHCLLLTTSLRIRRVSGSCVVFAAQTNMNETLYRNSGCIFCSLSSLADCFHAMNAAHIDQDEHVWHL